MYFPSKRGFRIGKYRESDGPRQKTLAVRKGLDIVVIVTYEPPCLLSQGHFSNNHSQFDLQAFKRPLVRLHSMGKIVAYMGLPFSGHEAPPHPDNWLYDLDEAGGINLIVECFSRVWTEIGLSREFSSHMPDIDNALDFLTEIPTRVRRGARGGAPPRSEDESATLAATDKHETNPVTPVSVVIHNRTESDMNESAARGSFSEGLLCRYRADVHGLSGGPRSEIFLPCEFRMQRHSGQASLEKLPARMD